MNHNLGVEVKSVKSRQFFLLLTTAFILSFLGTPSQLPGRDSGADKGYKTSSN